MNADSLMLREKAIPRSASVIRTRFRAFLARLTPDPHWRNDVLTAVGEAVANAVEHAYDPARPGDVHLCAKAGDGALRVTVRDEGRFATRPGAPDRGHGMRIMRAIADSVHIESAGGTRVKLTFRLR